MADLSNVPVFNGPVPDDAPAPLIDMAQLVADLDAAEAEEDAGQIVSWEDVEADLLQMAAACRARIARHHT